MSGYAGLVNFDSAPVNLPLLDAMTDRLVYRGPDRRAVWSADGVGMGHTLLITAPESVGERQPMTLDDCTIVADARVDDRAALVARLRANERSAAASLTEPDAALILRAYLAFGERCTDHLLGDFTFAIWDARQRRLFAARDHIGKRQFYYAQRGDTLFFGNEIRPLRLALGPAAALNDLHVVDYLMFGQGFWLDKTTTPYADIRRLAPAEQLSAHDGHIETRRYWQFPVFERSLRYRSEQEYVDHFLNVFGAAVKDRVRAPKISVTLSGGMDSSTTNSVLFDLLNKGEINAEPKVYTIVTTELPDQEGRFASLVVDALKIRQRHQIIPSDGYELEKPYVDLPAILRMEMQAMRGIDARRVMSQHSSQIIFSFMGEVLSGSHPISWYLRFMNPLDFARAYRRIWQVYHKRPPLRLGVKARLAAILRRRSRAPRVRVDYTFPGWFQPDIARALDLRERWRYRWYEAYEDESKQHNEMEQFVLAYEWNSYDESDAVDFAPGDIVDPFADVRVLSFFASLPPLPWFYGKFMTRRAMIGRLPPEIVYRSKRPFGDADSHLIRKPENAWIDAWQPHPLIERYVLRDLVPRVSGEHYQSLAASMVNLRPMHLNLWLDYETRANRLAVRDR